MAKEKSKVIKLSPVFEMLSGAIKIYWQNIFKFIKMLLWSLLGFIPLFLLSLVAFLLQDVWHLNGLGLQIILTILVTASILWLLYYWARVYLALFLMIKNNFKKKTIIQFQETRQLVWSYIGLIFLIILFLVPLFLIGSAFLVSLNLLPLAPLVLAMLLLGALILLVAGFTLAIFFGLAVFSLVFENLNSLAALKRSIFLIEKYWWSVFGRILFFGLVIWVFSLAISLPLALAPANSVFYSAWNMVIGFIQILVAPIYLLYMVNVYRDLVKIKGATPKK